MIPTYIVSEKSPFIKRGEGPSVIQNDHNIVVKDGSKVYFYDNDTFELIHKFKIFDHAFSNFKLRDATFVNLDNFTPWLDTLFWCQVDDKFTLFNVDGIVQSFNGVRDYQFSNDHLVILKDKLEIYDLDLNLVHEEPDVLEKGFIFDDDKLFVLKGNEEYPTRIIYKYNFPGMQVDASRFLNSDESYKIVGLDDKYIYAGVEDINVYRRSNFDHYTTIKKKEMQLDQHNLFIYSPDTRYRSKTTYILQDSPFFDVGVYPVQEEI